MEDFLNLSGSPFAVPSIYSINVAVICSISDLLFSVCAFAPNPKINRNPIVIVLNELIYVDIFVLINER